MAFGEEYYAFTNPYIFAALTELVEDFDILSAYKPVIARMLDDKNEGTFVLEQGGRNLRSIWTSVGMIRGL